MKRLLFIIILFMTAITYSYSEEKQAVNDTVVTSNIVDTQNDSIKHTKASSPDFTFSYESDNDNENLIPVVAIIMGCGMPIFIVAIVLWFRHKNKQAKYRLASEALAAGKPIPENLFSSIDETYQDIKNKGIRNICLGIGLTVFLKFITGSNGLAAIGFIILCMGVGQVVIAYTSKKKSNNNNIRILDENEEVEDSNSINQDKE